MEPLKVTIVEVFGERVRFKLNRYDESVVNIFRSLKSRRYEGSEINSISLEYLAALIQDLDNAKIALDYADGTKEAIAKLLDRPSFAISLDGRGNRLIIKPAPNQDSSPITHIPGHKYDYERQVWAIPIWEGWRLHEILSKVEKVQW